MVSLLELDEHNQQFTSCQQAGFSKNSQQLMTENRATSQHPGAGACRARRQRECMLRDRKCVWKPVLWQSERWCLQGSREAYAHTQRWWFWEEWLMGLPAPQHTSSSLDHREARRLPESTQWAQTASVRGTWMHPSILGLSVTEVKYSMRNPHKFLHMHTKIHLSGIIFPQKGAMILW